MQLSSHIAAIKSAFQTAVPAVPFYYHLAPETAVTPYAVFRLGTITPGDQDNTTRDWETTATVVAYTTTDTDILTINDAIVAAFERAAISGFYFSMVQSADIDFYYGDQQSYWSTTISITLRWTVST